MPNVFRSTLALTGLLSALSWIPSIGKAQFPQVALTAYVCQTPTFWCAFRYQSGVPNGSPCYCMTYWGPVTGSSIDPSGVSNAPKLPTPQSPSDPGRPPQTEPRPGGQVDPGDCYKGLGNCAGSFRNAASQRDGTDPRPGTDAGASSSAFGQALQKLIDAAADEFDEVKGAEESSSSVSTRYKVTVVPPGFDRCILFVPDNSRRRPWVSCFAKDDLTHTRLVNVVAELLGSRGTRETSGQTWMVGDIEVSTERDPVSLDIRAPR
jgi:hypothetical protein